jgi:hypothetical protein
MIGERVLIPTAQAGRFLPQVLRIGTDRGSFFNKLASGDWRDLADASFNA